jgi:hypothetical protein
MSLNEQTLSELTKDELIKKCLSMQKYIEDLENNKNDKQIKFSQQKQQLEIIKLKNILLRKADDTLTENGSKEGGKLVKKII